uniref:PAZ domain-containing protein n=1 Tax=Meloidogyne enterolobii TaxID=390850 RepID=A0A6V7TK30_MELEN|nr:unnamed protein product [Meloidogyne enterolobii]
MEESIDKRHEQLSSKDVNALIDSEKIQKSGRKRRARESSTSSSSSSGSSSSGSSGSSTGSSSSEEEEGEIKFKRIKVLVNNPSSSIGSLQQNVEKRQLSNTEKRLETVPQFLMRNLGISVENELSMIFKRDLNTINKLLNGKQLTALYGKKPINFVFGGLTLTGANRTFAFMKGPTVQQYILKKQQITLKHPEWPCLIQIGGGNHKSYYPIEIINIC